MSDYTLGLKFQCRINTMVPTKQQRDFTLKQKLWLKYYIETGNATEAAVRVYQCKDRNSAKQIGYENLTKLDYSELMEELGLTDKVLLQMVTIGIAKPDKLEKRLIEVETPEGKKVRKLRWVNTPDYAVRHKYLETAFKLKKRLGPESTRINNKLNIDGLQFVWGENREEVKPH